MTVMYLSAGECGWRCSGVLQWAFKFWAPDRTDAIRASQSERAECPELPHQPGAAAGPVHRGQECLHWDQVSLPASSGWYPQSSHTPWLHTWGRGTLIHLISMMRPHLCGLCVDMGLKTHWMIKEVIIKNIKTFDGLLKN